MNVAKVTKSFAPEDHFLDFLASADPALSSRSRAFRGGDEATAYATPRALMGAAESEVEAAGCEFRTARAAIGFSQSRAMNAATTSHTIIAQKTFTQEPVLANNQAAPGAASSAATPLAVYTSP